MVFIAVCRKSVWYGLEQAKKILCLQDSVYNYNNMFLYVAVTSKPLMVVPIGKQSYSPWQRDEVVPIGNSQYIITCLVILWLAVVNVSFDFQDIAFISMANILFRSKKINDAIKVTNMALNASNNLAISHFNLANLYAKKVCRIRTGLESIYIWIDA